MQFEIKPSEDLEISYKGQAIKIVRPKVAYLRKFKKRLNAATKDGAEESDLDVMYDYCVAVGVPEAILDQWDLKEMTQLFNHLNADEKKS